MKINTETPIVIEPTPQKVFDALWIYNLNIHAPSIMSGRAKFEFLPYDYENKIIGEGKDLVTLDIDDLWACVNEVPEVAQVFGAIINSIEPLRAWIKLQEDKKALENTPVES
jgi:hypothetical protein